MKITLLTGKIFDIETRTDLPVKAVRSARCRRLSLRIDTKERKAVLTVPPLTTAWRALRFIEANRAWIEEHLQKIPENKPFFDGQEISLFGNLLRIVHNPQLKGGVLVKNNVLEVSGNVEFLSRRVVDFIKQEAQKYMLELSRQKAAMIDCRVNRVIMKDTKSRWGSCSTLNNINYNWRIALAPLEVIDYLVAHEAAHLKHHDHSREFWNCVKNLSPQAAAGRRWLKLNSHLLYAFA